MMKKHLCKLKRILTARGALLEISGCTINTQTSTPIVCANFETAVMHSYFVDVVYCCYSDLQ